MKIKRDASDNRAGNRSRASANRSRRGFPLVPLSCFAPVNAQAQPLDDEPRAADAGGSGVAVHLLKKGRIDRHRHDARFFIQRFLRPANFLSRSFRGFPPAAHRRRQRADIGCIRRDSIQFRIREQLGRLHRSGTERDSAGNRTLFFDDYTKLVLTYLFNPLIDSSSMLQRAAALPKLAAQLGIKDFSKASFSEAPAVFDPQKLEGPRKKTGSVIPAAMHPAAPAVDAARWRS
jgi:hypothetical protein